MYEIDNPDEAQLLNTLADMDQRQIWAMVEASPDGILLSDEQGIIVLVNARLEEMFRFSRRELLGRPVEVLIPDGQREAHIRHRSGYEANPNIRAMGSGLALSGVRKDGTEFPVEVSLNPIPGQRQMSVVAIVRDISDRLQGEKEVSNQQAKLRILQYRQRLAEDLHDLVIQRLFAAGMGLQSVQPLIDEPTASRRVSDTVTQIDETIAELRAAIFGLKEPLSDNVVARIGDVLSNSQNALGFRPTLTIHGDPEVIPELLVENLLPAITEALSNVARHAEATRAEVVVASTDDGIELKVIDNGSGYLAGQTEGRGLANLAYRAERLDGSMSLAANPDSGSTLVWTVQHTGGAS